jgi:hypothetical protein
MWMRKSAADFVTRLLPAQGDLMYEDRFNHYLSYSATDQQTVSRLVGQFDGLLVPGTIAVFQREGTGGFVLSLSAANRPFTYLIDPRFPLFQQALPSPKKSHTVLAELLGDGKLVQSSPPKASDFSSSRLRNIAESWLKFNTGYTSVAGGKFAKYAARLKIDLVPSDARAPEAVIPPYFMCEGLEDPWWRHSIELFEATKLSAPSGTVLLRVVAVKEVQHLESLCVSVNDERIGIWVSGLDEVQATTEELFGYLKAIRAISETGMKSFALYGGFFSVLLQNVGLGGSSHGIGYGENRRWLELPQSGQPPARYYVPQLHRYLQPDEARRLQVADERLAGCQCPECINTPANRLDYQALMRHSVYCRSIEVDEWSNLELGDISVRLTSEIEEWRRLLRSSSLTEVEVTQSLSRARHIDTWAHAFAMSA